MPTAVPRGSARAGAGNTIGTFAAGVRGLDPADLSVVDRRHVGVVVACAGGGLQVVQSFELRFGELDLVGCGVLLAAGAAGGGGGRGDVDPGGGGARESGLGRG